MNCGPKSLKVLLTTQGAWHLPHTASAFAARHALAGLWISEKNRTRISPELYRRGWLFHLALKPFLHCSSQIWQERAFYTFFPLWKAWLWSHPFPECNVVHAISGFATEPFDRAEKIGALKVIDCPNSHPSSFYGYWQRECDLWCPGEKVPIPRWFFGRICRELKRADLVLCPSNFVRDTMIANGIPAQNCFINPFGVDTSLFRPRQTLPDKPRFVCVGTICLRKGHQYLFRAFEIVKKRLPEAELICIGLVKSDFRRELSKWRSLFTHIPQIPQSEVAELLTTCTAFVLPSQEEGFARVLTEAMGAGLPILASYESGATTLVADGVEGLTVSAHDPQHIANAMIRVATDLELNRRMGEAACKKGTSKNTWLDYGDRLLGEYARRLRG